MKVRARWICLMVILLGAAEMQGQAPVLVVEGGTLIDGTGGAPLKDAAIVIEGTRIKAVGAKGQVAYPPDAQVVNVGGKTILPGLIDSHVHFIDWMPPMDLHWGVTTVFDTSSGPLEWILATRDALNSGRIKGPRMFVTGAAIDGPLKPPDKAPHTEAVLGGYIQTVQTVEEARATVRKIIARGVDAIKVYEGLTMEMLKVIVEEANKSGLQLVGHTRDAREAATAGFKFVEHTAPIARATISDKAKLQEMAEKNVRKIEYAMDPNLFDPVIRYLIKEGVYLNPTFSTDWALASPREKHWMDEAAELARDPAMAFVPLERRQIWQPGGLKVCSNGLFSGRGGCIERRDPALRPQVEEGYRKVQDFVRRYALAGGKVVTGSDTGIVPGLEIHHEMQSLVDAGLTPMQAIMGSTKYAAELFHKEKDLGTVQAGKTADLIAVEGDPLKDISVTSNVRLVIKDGKIIDTAFDPSFKSPLPYPNPRRR